jgi:quercetin dioxygenase-like cupin family protein
MPIAMMLFEDALRPGEARALPPALRLLYTRRGTARFDGVSLAEDEAHLSQDSGSLEGEGEVWRFELTRVPEGWRVPAEHRDSLVLARVLERDAAAHFTLRLDRVTFTPGLETPAHGHHGQGIRRLIAGRLFMEIGALTHRLDAGRAWFESGEEPVVGRGLEPGTSFLRCMVLDAAMLGRSSFKGWTPEDEHKPRNVAYRQYLDTVVALER